MVESVSAEGNVIEGEMFAKSVLKDFGRDVGYVGRVTGTSYYFKIGSPEVPVDLDRDVD